MRQADTPSLCTDPALVARRAEARTCGTVRGPISEDSAAIFCQKVLNKLPEVSSRVACAAVCMCDKLRAGGAPHRVYVAPHLPCCAALCQVAPTQAPSLRPQPPQGRYLSVELARADKKSSRLAFSELQLLTQP